MTSPNPQSNTLDVLPRADGSAQYTQHGYTVLGAVNAPTEVQRRDELPEEAAIEVNVRPAAGVGGVRERHLESLIHATLRAVVLVQNFPRTLIQVTLQIASSAPPDSESATSHSSQYVSPLPLLPALLQTALLALLAASIPLSTTYTSVLLAAAQSRSQSSTSPLVVADPSPLQLRDAASVHVLAFSAQGEMLLAESEGEFDVGVWERVVGEEGRVCRGGNGGGGGEDGGVEMDVEGQGMGMGMEKGLREVVRGKVEREGRWREEVR